MCILKWNCKNFGYHFTFPCGIGFHLDLFILRERLWYGLSATDFHNVFYMLTTSVNFWLLMPLIITASILPDLTLVAIRVMKKEKLKVPRISKTAEKVGSWNILYILCTSFDACVYCDIFI